MYTITAGVGVLLLFDGGFNPPGTNINWDWLHDVEGGIWDTPYVPLKLASGVTIGAGVDLGNGPVSTSAAFAAALPDADYANNPNLDDIAENYLGVKGNPSLAAALLGPNVQTLYSKNGNESAVYSNVVDITDNQAEELTRAAETPILTALLNKWEAAAPNIPFSTVPMQAESVLMSVAYQYGGIDTTSQFWDDMVAGAEDGDWSNAVKDLRNWPDSKDPVRRMKEADYLSQLVPGSSPPSTANVNGTSIAGGGETYASVAVNTGTIYQVDPSGSSMYTLIEDAGSPNLETVTLPTLDGVSNYRVSAQTASGWLPSALAAPGAPLILPDGTTGITIETLDANHDVVTSNSSISFGVTFTDNGTFSGTLTVGPPSSSDLAVFDTTTQQNDPATAQPYSGPVAGLQNQYIYPGADNVNISVSDDNWFLHGGPGNDAIAASGGYNVLDGGAGSNFLTGGATGTDTFFVDDRSPSGDIWSTVNGFHAGDDATVFGVVPNADNSNIQWFDNQGAAGYTGLTLHVPTPGQPTASLTLPGYATSDLSNGRLAVQFGNEADGTPFMHVIANG